MNWSLLLSDTLARVIGLLGLVASAAWIAGTTVGWPGTGPALQFGVGAALFCLMMTLFYLVPAYHDRMMRRTVRGFAKVPFQVLGGAWCVVVIAGLFLAGAALDGLSGTDVSRLFWPIASALAVTVALVLIFPGGLAWRQPEAERGLGAAFLSPEASDEAEAPDENPEFEDLRLDEQL